MLSVQKLGTERVPAFNIGQRNGTRYKGGKKGQVKARPLDWAKLGGLRLPKKFAR